MTIRLGNQLLVRVQEQMAQNISAIKNQLIEWLERPESGGVEQVANKFSELGGSLSLLSQNDAANLAETLIGGLAFLNKKIVDGEYTGDDDYFIDAGAELAAGLLVLEDYVEHLTNINEAHVNAAKLATETVNAFVENRKIKKEHPQPQISSATYEALALRINEITEASRSQIDQYIRNKDPSFNIQTIINNNNNLISLFELLNIKAPTLLLQKINESINAGLNEAQWIEIAEAMILATEALNSKTFFKAATDSLDKARNEHTLHSRLLEVSGVSTATAKMAQMYFQQLRKDVVHFEKLTDKQSWAEASHFLYEYGNVFSMIGYEKLGKELCHLSLDYAELSMHSTEQLSVAYPPVVDSLVAIEHIFNELVESDKIEDTALTFLSTATREIATALPISAQAKTLYQSYATRRPADDDEDVDDSSLTNVLSDLGSFFESDISAAFSTTTASHEEVKQTESDNLDNGFASTFVAPATATANTGNSNVISSVSGDEAVTVGASATKVQSPVSSTNISGDEDLFGDLSPTPETVFENNPATENSEMSLELDTSLNSESMNTISASTNTSENDASLVSEFDSNTDAAVTSPDLSAAFDSLSIEPDTKTSVESTTENKSTGNGSTPYFVGKKLEDLDTLGVPEEKSNFLVSNEAAVVDEEIREFFMEEFQEIIANIREIYPNWRKDVLEGTLTNDIRRAFHTLKGSGRTVGYESLGEFAWQHERLLNGVIEKLYTANSLVQETIGDAIDLLFILNEQEEFLEPKGALLSQALAAERIRDAIAANPNASEAELRELSRQLRLSDGTQVEEHTSEAVAMKDEPDFSDAFDNLEFSNDSALTSPQTNAPTSPQIEAIETAAIEAHVRQELQAKQEEIIKQQVAAQLSARTELSEDAFTGIARTFKTALSVGDIDSSMEDAIASMISHKFGTDDALKNDNTRQKVSERLAEMLNTDSELLGQILDKAVGKFIATPEGFSKEEFNRITSILRNELVTAYDDKTCSTLANEILGQISSPTLDKVDAIEGVLTEIFNKEQHEGISALPNVFKNIRAGIVGDSIADNAVDFGLSVTNEVSNHAIASVGLANETADQLLDAGISLADEVSENAIASVGLANETADQLLDAGISLADGVSENAVASVGSANETADQLLDAGISLADGVSENAIASVGLANETADQLLDAGISLADGVSENAVASIGSANETADQLLDAGISLADGVSKNAIASVGSANETVEGDLEFEISLTDGENEGFSASVTKSDMATDYIDDELSFDDVENFSQPSVFVNAPKGSVVGSLHPTYVESSEDSFDVSVDELIAADEALHTHGINEEKDFFDELEDLNNQVSRPVVKVTGAASTTNVVHSEPTSGTIPSISEVGLPSMPFTRQVDWSKSHTSASIQAVDRLSQELSTISNVEVPVQVSSSARSAVFLRAVDKFENLSQLAESGQTPEIINDLLDSVYDIEDSIESNNAPHWVWHVLDAIEQLLLNYKNTGDFISFSAASILRHSASLIENFHENTEDEALEAISELMNERKDSVKERVQVANNLGITPTILGDVTVDPNAGTVLAQTFIDEAMMLFNRSQNRAEDWDSNTEQTSHLDSIRRDMHTLKGSARMAGYSAIGDLTHAIESLIESIVDGYTKASPNVSAILSNAMWQGTVMIDSIRDGFLPQPDPRTLNEICACLNQPLPYPNYSDIASISDGEYREISTHSGNAVLEENIDAVEEIFGNQNQETNLDNLDELENMLASSSEHVAPVVANNELSQIVKDAVNSAVKTQLDGESAIGESVNELADMFNEPETLEDSLAASESNSFVDNFAIDDIATFGNSVPAGAIDAASAAVIANTVASAVTDAMNTVNENNLALDEDLAELHDAFDESKTETKVVEVPTPVSSLEIDKPETNAPVVTSAPTVEKTEAPQLTASPKVEKPTKTARPFDDSIDPALVEIFTDEAQELLSTTNQLLSGSLADESTVNELKRAMHTLKGGARLIGFTEIGDTAHLMESVVERMDAIPAEKVETAQSLLSLALEALFGMVDNVLRSEMPEAASAINESLKLFSEKGEYIPPSQFAHIEEESITETVAPATVAPVAEAAPIADTKTEVKTEQTNSRAFDDSIDPTLVEIFTNEAQELLASSAQLLQGSLADENIVNELKRAMHTLKGGARLVGFANSIGDTSHLMESVVERLERYPTQNVQQAHVLLNTAMESLFSMLDTVLRNEMPEPAATINESLKLFSEKGEYKEPAKFAAASATTEPEPKAVTETTPTPKIEATNQKAQIEAELIKSKEKKQETAKSQQKRDTNSDLSRFVRVDAELLDEMIAMLGESAIMRSRMENVTSDSEYNLNELTRVATRISEQVRRLDNETEAQMLSRRDRFSRDDEHFDPLEMDRFSELQQLSRQLSEAIDDLKNIQDTLSQDNVVLRNLTLQQGVVYRDLQDRLLATQLMRFDIHEPRLKRLIKQTATSIGKEVNFVLEGGDVELERRLLDDLLPSLEHMIRNSIAHGIETPEKRIAVGKNEVGTIKVAVSIRAAEISVRIIDDGAGIDYDKIRAKAKAKGMLDPERSHDENYLNSLMMKSGFSTAENLSQLSGRGVGMDVVHEMLKQRRGQIHAYSISGKGTEFDVTMPFSMSIAEVLLVEIAGQAFAAPMSAISAVAQLDAEELRRSYDGETIYHRYQDTDYRVFILGKYFKPDQYEMVSDGNRAPVLLINTSGEGVAFHIDRILNRMEIIVKNVNRQVLNIPGISGATILGDGRVVPVLELLDLSRRINELNLNRITVVEEEETAKNILVVDDSVTMRKVSTRLLERNHYNVATAKDGLDAIEVLQTFTPDLIMLDIEMPRMDGFEFANHVRQSENPLVKNVPIIMITSRTGDKHRDRADQIGVQGYLGKPYREDVLLETLDKLLQK